MLSRIARLVTILVSLGAALPTSAFAQPQSLELPGDRLQLGRRDRRSIEEGRVVTKILDVSSEREVAALGIVRINAPIDFIVERFSDVESFFSDIDIVRQLGTFSDTPTPDDLHGLRFDEDDIDALEDCEVGDCGLKLPSDAIEEIRAAVDWSQPNARSQAAAIISEQLVGYLGSYMSAGDAGLPTYHDKSEPLSAAEGFRILQEDSRWLLDGDASPGNHPADLHQPQTRGPEDVFYWMVEDVGVRPITSLNHMTVVRRPGAGPASAAIAMKQIYANHYLQAGVRIASLTPISGQDPQSGTYLVYYVHLLFDNAAEGIMRLMVERRVKSTWATTLETIRRRAEDDHRLALVSTH